VNSPPTIEVWFLRAAVEISSLTNHYWDCLFFNADHAASMGDKFFRAKLSRKKFFEVIETNNIDPYLLAESAYRVDYFNTGAYDYYRSELEKGVDNAIKKLIEDKKLSIHTK